MLEKTDILVIALVMLLNPIFALIRGSRKKASIVGLDRCTSFDYGTVCLYFLIIFALARFNIKDVMRRNKGFKLSKNDAPLTDLSFILKYCVASCIVSIVAGYISAASSTLMIVLMMAL